MKYNVRYSRTINYLVTVEAETEGRALELAERIAERADQQRPLGNAEIDVNDGEVEFESIECAPVDPGYEAGRIARWQAMRAKSENRP